MNNTQNKEQSNIIKKSVVITPEYVAQKIYKNVNRFPFKTILDIGCYNGNLSKPFNKKKNSQIIGLDIEGTYKDRFDKFLHLDFVNSTSEDFKGIKPDLILTNPPFGKHSEENSLYPYLFLKKVIEIWGINQPVIMICGHWFLSNSSERINFLNSLNLTKNTTLHKRTFEDCGVSVESNILYFNIKQKTPNDFLDYTKEKKKQQFKNVAFTYDQVEFINKNVGNFSLEVKKLLKEKYPNFPDSPKIKL